MTRSDESHLPAEPSRLPHPTETIAVLGDVHGHLQLGLCVLARWQRELGVSFAAVFLCGDVGTFTDASQFDNATHKHARTNRCELEFLEQWSATPPAPGSRGFSTRWLRTPAGQLVCPDLARFAHW